MNEEKRLKRMYRKDILEKLESVITSCNEGYDQTWDSSTNEGKEGFISMRDYLEEVKEYIKEENYEKR
jgi:hypothetical protein